MGELERLGCLLSQGVLHLGTHQVAVLVVGPPGGIHRLRGADGEGGVAILHRLRIDAIDVDIMAVRRIIVACTHIGARGFSHVVSNLGVFVDIVDDIQVELLVSIETRVLDVGSGTCACRLHAIGDERAHHNLRIGVVMTGR